MSRPTHLQNAVSAKYAVIREVAGSPPVADSTDLNAPVFDVTEGRNVRPYDSVVLGVEIDSTGGTPKVEIELLYHSDEGDPAWRRLTSGGSAVTTGAMLPGEDVEISTYGHPIVFPRIVNITDGAQVTAIRILARGGKQRRT